MILDVTWSGQALMMARNCSEGYRHVQRSKVDEKESACLPMPQALLRWISSFPSARPLAFSRASSRAAAMRACQ
jgi:hypothetical protein